MINAAITLVTVIFAGETNLLKLQARSIAKFAEDAFIDDIILILNDPHERALRKTIVKHILPEYGPFKKRVRLLAGQKMIGHYFKNGWRGQQVLKLAVARHLKTDWYCLLDAKNHFVRSFDTMSFYDDGVRPFHFDTRVSDSYLAERQNGLALFGLEDGGAAEKHLPYITPFAMHTAHTRELLDYADKAFGSIVELFKSQKVMEFLLYDAWLRYKNIPYHELYKVRTRKPLLTFWEGSTLRGAAFSRRIQRINHPETYTLALHRHVFRLMEPHFKNWVASVWIDRGLVKDRDEAEIFLNSPAL